MREHHQASSDGWPSTVRVTLARTVLATLAGLAVWPLLLALLGLNVAAIASGSMSPGIRVGDVVASSPVAFDEVRAGQIVTVHNPAVEGQLLTHRVHAVRADGSLLTKGDANADVDSTPVPVGSAWLGRLRIPWVGFPKLWLDDGSWVALGSAAAALALLARCASDRPLVRPDERGRLRLSPVTAGLVALTVVAAPLGAARSDAAFAATTITGASSWTAAGSALGPFGDAVLADSPFLFFRMDEQSGDVVVDSSGNGHTSGYRGSPTRDVAGALPGQTTVNSATLFGGVSAITSSRVYANTADFTFEAFVKSRSWADNDGTSTIAELRTATGFRDRIFVQYGSLYYQADEASAPLHLQWNIPGDATWHYLAVSMSGASVTIRMDTSVWRGTVPGRDTVTAARFVIGTHLQPYDDPGVLGVESYKGVMDEVALYTYALTEAQMAAHYAASRA